MSCACAAGVRGVWCVCVAMVVVVRVACGNVLYRHEQQNNVTTGNEQNGNNGK